MKIIFHGIMVVIACSVFIGRMEAASRPSPTSTPTPLAPPIPPEMVALHDQLAAILSQAARAWVAEEADKACKNTKITEANIRADIQTRFTGQSLTDQDKNILQFVVLTEAAQKMADDLGNMINDLKKKHAQDQTPPASPTGPDATTTINLSPEESILLQTAVQRRTQFISTMSNVKKKISSTQSAVVGKLQ